MRFFRKKPASPSSSETTTALPSPPSEEHKALTPSSFLKQLKRVDRSKVVTLCPSCLRFIGESASLMSIFYTHYRCLNCGWSGPFALEVNLDDLAKMDPHLFKQILNEIDNARKT